MLSSLDGKISTGAIDARDVDKDFPKIKGVKEGLKQYYQLELRTDIHSFNTGRVMAKISMNKPQKNIKKIKCSFILVDNTHLTSTGIKNLLRKVRKLYLITTNNKHPAFKQTENNLEIIFYKNKINFKNLFNQLKKTYGINRVTIQSGGTMNSILIREGLIDRVSLVIAPCLIGGKDTPTLVDGDSLRSQADLKKIKALKLKKFTRLKNHYLHLVYEVINNK